MRTASISWPWVHIRVQRATRFLITMVCVLAPKTGTMIREAGNIVLTSIQPRGDSTAVIFRVLMVGIWGMWLTQGASTGITGRPADCPWSRLKWRFAMFNLHLSPKILCGTSSQPDGAIPTRITSRLSNKLPGNRRIYQPLILHWTVNPRNLNKKSYMNTGGAGGVNRTTTLHFQHNPSDWNCICRVFSHHFNIAWKKSEDKKSKVAGTCDVIYVTMVVLKTT